MMISGRIVTRDGQSLPVGRELQLTWRSGRESAANAHGGSFQVPQVDVRLIATNGEITAIGARSRRTCARPANSMAWDGAQSSAPCHHVTRARLVGRRDGLAVATECQARDGQREAPRRPTRRLCRGQRSDKRRPGHEDRAHQQETDATAVPECEKAVRACASRWRLDIERTEPPSRLADASSRIDQLLVARAATCTQ